MGHNYVCILHRWLDELVVTGFDEAVVLLEDVLDCTATLFDVALNSPGQPDVIIGHHKDLEVHQGAKPLFVES